MIKSKFKILQNIKLNNLGLFGYLQQSVYTPHKRYPSLLEPGTLCFQSKVVLAFKMIFHGNENSSVLLCKETLFNYQMIYKLIPYHS